MKFLIANVVFFTTIISTNGANNSVLYGEFNGSTSSEPGNDTDAVNLYYTTIPEYLTVDAVDALEYIVALHDSPKGKTYCAGTLVHKRWVLTTNACAPTKSGFLGIGWYYKTQYAVIGAIRETGFDGSDKIKIINRFPHSDYNKKTRENDYMMLKLAKESSYTPVTLAQDGEHWFEFNTTGFVFGWQSNPEATPHPWTGLLNTTVDWAPDCKKIVDKVYASEFCAIGTKSTDACRYGDGSPVIVRVATNDLLVGMVSYNPGCGKANTPTLFARECKAQQWAMDTIRSYS